eukprot:SAG25_NODE_2791_length_1382_cov_4.375422_1_plen_190_part_00
MDAGRGSHHVCSHRCHHDIVRYHLLHVIEVPLRPGDASGHAMQLRNTQTHTRTHAHAHKSGTRTRLHHHPRPHHTHSYAQKWAQLMPRQPHACGTKGRDSRGALRAVTPPASCWSARLLRGCGQQTARQRTHRRHRLRISVGGRPLAARRPRARLHGRRPAHSGHSVQPCTTSMAQTDAHARKRDNSSP